MIKSAPQVGDLIFPLHRPNSFNTVLKLETRKTGEIISFRIEYLRIRDNIKIRTPWFPDAETFWRYYGTDEK